MLLREDEVEEQKKKPHKEIESRGRKETERSRENTSEWRVRTDQYKGEAR